VFFYQAMGF